MTPQESTVLLNNKNITEENLRNLYFGDFSKNKFEKRIYEEITDFENLRDVTIDFDI